jgi:hypothetical protein
MSSNSYIEAGFDPDTSQPADTFANVSDPIEGSTSDDYDPFADAELVKPRESLSSVFAYVIRHPLETMILRWNWKAAVLSALLRAPIFFFAYLFKKDGLKLAIGAALAQSAFRLAFGGINGAIIQSFSKVEPPWHAVLTVPIVLATFSHLMEFVVQTLYDHQTGAAGRGKAIAISVFVSAVSAVFNLFAMRRGALLVKDESRQSLWRDLVRMPWIIFEFLSFPLVWTWRNGRRLNGTIRKRGKSQD